MAEREFRTTPQWPIATTPLSGDELVEVWKGGKQYYVPFSELGGMPAAHSGTHKHGGDDEVGTLDNLAYEIPKLDADGLIDSRVSDASTTTKGKVQLATDGEEDATKPPTSTDSRLKDARPPTAHAAQHIAGTDVIADATVSNSGLMSAADKVKADATIPAYIPTEDQKAALVGSYGTPSAVNRFVTESDPVLSSGGGGGGITGLDLLGIGQIGNGVSISINTGQCLVHLSATEVALVNGSDNLAKYSFDGSDWSLVGNVLSTPGFSSHSCIGPLTSTDIVLYNETEDELATYRFDGTNWSKYGNGLSLLLGTNPTIAKLSSSEIAIRDGGNLAKYSFDGSDWSLVGNVLGISSLGMGGSGCVTALTATDVAMVSEPNEKLGVYRFDGTNWSDIGVFLDMPGIDETSIASISATDIALIDDGLEQLSIYRFNGSVWAKVGKSLTISGANAPSIAMLTESTVALVSSYNGKLRTYNFLFGYDSTSVNVAADYEVPEISTGKSIVIRRTSAYNGNPVTITPPSGATFEGLASISLYGQYSFVELERISETVFAIKDIQDTPPLDTEQVTNEKWVDGKRVYKKIVDFGALPDTTSKTVPHGLTYADILFVSVSGLARSSTETIQLSHIGTDIGTAQVVILPTSVRIITDWNASIYIGLVILKYTKS